MIEKRSFTWVTPNNFFSIAYYTYYPFLHDFLVLKVGMHFTQPTTRCRMWSWKSQGTPFRGLITPEQSRTLINGLAAKMLALNILRNFDGLKALFVPSVQKKLTGRP
jgi:hypothetical protein